MMVGGLPMLADGVCEEEAALNGGQSRRRGCISVIILVALVMSNLGLGSVARKFGHRFLGAVIINQRFAGCGGGDESSRGGIIERPRQAQAGLVEAGNGVVCEQRIGATDQSQMMKQV